MAKNLHKKDFVIWMNPYDSIKLTLKPSPPQRKNDINVEKLHAL